MRPLCLAVGAALAAAATFASAQTLPGTDTTLTIGGYVKLDAIFNSRSCGANCGGDQLLTPQLIPVGPGAGDNERGQLTVHARQSRVNVRTNTPTTKGPFTNPSGTFSGSTTGSLGGINKSDRAAHVNLIHSPVRKIDVGVEYTYAEREIRRRAVGFAEPGAVFRPVQLLKAGLQSGAAPEAAPDAAFCRSRSCS